MITTTKKRRLQRIRGVALERLLREMERTYGAFISHLRRVLTNEEYRAYVEGYQRGPDFIPAEILAKIEADPDTRALWQRIKEIIAAARLLD